MLDGGPERLDSLSREIAAALVDGGEGKPERNVRLLVERRNDRGFRVQRVEHGLDQEEVDAALAERAHLVRIGAADRIERDSTVRRLVDARRQRERDVERADRPRDEARLVGRPSRPLVGGAPRDSRALDVHLVHGILEGVVGLPDGRRRKGVGRRDVRPRGEVLVVNARDDVRPGEVQQVWVARDVAWMVAEPLPAIRLLAAHLALDQHAPGAVEYRDPLAEDGIQLLSRCLLYTSDAADEEDSV